jgi:DNA polymerase I-like protein with 3'-5' exonuclease and polymerase domains
VTTSGDGCLVLSAPMVSTMTNSIKGLTGSPLPAHTISYVTTTAQAVEALARLATAEDVAADTETQVVRDELGNLVSLNASGPGPVRVLSMAGRINGVIEAYVFDLGSGVAIDPEVAHLYQVTGVTDIDRSKVAPLLSQVAAYGWNADFDERVLDEAKIPLRSWRDLMLAHASLVLGESGVKFYDSLDYASKRYLRIPIEGKGSVQLSYTVSDPLSAEQVMYAALDAVTTCALAGVIMSSVNEAQLLPTVEVEWGARPFRSRMERRGIYFDVTGWRGVLAEHQTAIDGIESQLADMTGGGIANLFDYVERPTWNPNSTTDVKQQLNKYAPDQVKRQLNGRLFEKSDSVDNATLQMLDHPLASMILMLRDHQKTISTYGESHIEYVRADGRIHARYLQTIVSTGRLSSSQPNMQNSDPTMKHYYRPENTFVRVDGKWQADPDARVFVMGDLSQAELRFAAEVSGDEALIEAFNQGADMHAVTASRMFHVDMEELKISDPKEFKVYRQRGKTMNFAVIYGLGPRSLATRLTLAGVPTTDTEAKTLLALYLEAFPKMAIWLQGRDAYIRQMSSQPPRCDFAMSMKLLRLHPLVSAAKKALKGQDVVTSRDVALQINSRDEITAQLAAKLGNDPSEEEIESEITRRVEMVEWAEMFHAPVILLPDKTAFSFESRTILGRRRVFNVSTKSWLDSIIQSVMRARRGNLVTLRQGFEAVSGEKLTMADGSNLSRESVKKRFENKDLRDAFVSYVFANLAGQTEDVCSRALADCISGLGNAYRNAPIQGGVADAGLKAFGLLNERLSRFDDAFMVQTVHDSIVIECKASEAQEVAQVLQSSMAEALLFFCPSVLAVADVEIAASLDAGKDLIEDEDLARLVQAA